MERDAKFATRRKLLAVSGSVALFSLAGCLGDDDEATPDDDGDDHDDHDHDHDDHDPADEVQDGHFDEIGIGEFEILDRAHDPHEEVAYMHDDHWHGSLPTVPPGDTVSLGAYVEDEGGDEIELGDEYELKAAVAAGADDSVVSFDYHGDHVHIIGEEEGVTEIVFLVWHGDHADYQTDAITVQVSDEGEDDHGSVAEFEILDRAYDPHETVAYVHDDHWHGDLPVIPLDDTVSLGATIEDDEGDEIVMNGEYELRVDLAEGAPEDVVSFDYHGDHVHVIGEEEGVTEVVFQLYHDDHVDYETPAIVAQVSADPDEEGDHDADAIADVHILDRAHDPHEEVADHHDDHWHGELPEVPVDDNVSLGAVFEDEDGNEIPLGDEYELRVALAEGADDIVSFDYHGDHVHIIGEEEGETEVVFQLYHDDHVDYETAPIEVVVIEG